MPPFLDEELDLGLQRSLLKLSSWLLICRTGGEYLVANTFSYKARKKWWTEGGNTESA